LRNTLYKKSTTQQPNLPIEVPINYAVSNRVVRKDKLSEKEVEAETQLDIKINKLRKAME
jgi:hypothetical protein